jgi:2-polyprenyl-3-methyl-5-hydroxy-6-metoxy-1,4-benzoquinol methylase
LVSLYEQLEDPTYEEGKDNRALQMRWVIDVGVRLRTQAETLLEIGSGIGLLIREATNRGLDAVGIEPSRSLVKAAKRVGGVELIQGTFPHAKVAGRKFDLIYMVDVIEHVSDPVELLTACREALAPDGVLVLVTPDIGSTAARLLGRRWWHLRLAHVGYFDTHSMKRAADAAGLNIGHSERALWFFPVRYLAERLGVYLPIKGLVRATSSIPGFRSLYRQIVPLNLHDSLLVTLHKAT